VSVPGTAERLVGIAVERFGGLDILVNNSGGPPRGDFTDFGDEAWQDAGTARPEPARPPAANPNRPP
jgi:3-oxoacyl-[acyl-carrier protein] reductase